MDTNFLATIQKNLGEQEIKLQAELEELTGQAGKQGAYQMAPPDYGSDEDENSAEVEAFTNDLSVKEVLESSLRDVRGALERIGKGTYGVCKYCQQPIDERRLQARPASSSCINCKQALKDAI